MAGRINNFIKNSVDKLDKQSIRMLLFTLATIFMLLVVSAFPIAIMAFLGMMPSLIVLILEAKSSMNLFRTILPLNVLGVSWVYSDIINQVLVGSITISDTVGNSNYWLIIIGMVVFGLFLYFAMPRVVYSWTYFKYTSEIKLLHHRREKLREIWGSELVTRFVERAGAGSDIIDFLLRNGMMEDLEGNISFARESTAETSEGSKKTELAKVILPSNGADPIDNGLIEKGFSLTGEKEDLVISPFAGAEEADSDDNKKVVLEK